MEIDASRPEIDLVIHHTLFFFLSSSPFSTLSLRPMCSISLPALERGNFGVLFYFFLRAGVFTLFASIYVFYCLYGFVFDCLLCMYR